MQSGPSSPLDDNFITAVHQYCTGESNGYKLFWREAAQQAGALLCKIYFSWDTIIISNSYQSVSEQRNLLRYHNRDISFMCIGSGNKHYYLGRKTGSATHPCIACKSLSRWPANMGFSNMRSHEAQQSMNLRASSHGRELAFTGR